MISSIRLAALAGIGALVAHLASASALAITYYVDYAGGLDSNAGTSAAAPFKRCPGDAAATGTALATTLSAGDKVVFKGGVEYPVELLLKWSGAPGNPITFDGNTAGTFGTGPAIFTGADHVTTWTQCTSSADAGGAADWSNCYKAIRVTPWADDPFMVNLFYDSVRGQVARFPNGVDPLYWDNADAGYTPLALTEITDTTITLPATFVPTPAPGQTWPDAWVGNRNTSNLISLRPIASVSGDGTVLTFATAVTPRTSLNSFALFNDGKVLDQRGEYLLISDPTNGPRTKIVFYAGPSGAPPSDALVSVKRSSSTLTSRTGLDLNEKSHYVIQGMTFRNYAAGAGTSNRNGVGIGNYEKSSASSTDILIQDCSVVYCQNLTKSGAININDTSFLTIDSCYIAENQGTRGITTASDDAVISNNTVTRGGGTAIFTSGAARVQIVANNVFNNDGLHGNGISVYEDSTNVTVARNCVINSNFALTVQSAIGLDVYYNVFKHPPTAGSSCAVALYGNHGASPDSANITIRNNTILGEPKKSFRVDAQDGNGGLIANLTVENNIIDGSTCLISKITTMNNNLFLSKYVASGGTYIGPTDHYNATDPTPFVNATSDNYHLVDTAWAVNNGIAWSDSGGDLEGSLIAGTRDVGAFEYHSPGRVFAGGKGHSVALKADGTVWTWGLNDKGQLGNGTTTNTKVPAPLASISGATSIASGYQHTLALKSDGTVWAWGLNNYGELGDGTTTDRSAPVQVSSLTGVTFIVAGDYHNFALKGDGTLWAWGQNTNSKLGIAGGNQTTPQQVTAISNVVQIAGGGLHTVALKSDGTVWAWGKNSNGQLGNGTNIDSATPVQVTGLSNIDSIACGTTHSVAVSDSGALYTWGLNTNGQLGDGTTGNRNAPYQVAGIGSVFKATAGNAYTQALMNSGEVWCWGSNAQGQIGAGVTGGNYLSPSKITALSAIADIGTGWYHGLHRRADGTVAAVGYNLYGQVGDNTNTTRSTPVTAIGIDLD